MVPGLRARGLPKRVRYGARSDKIEGEGGIGGPSSAGSRRGQVLGPEVSSSPGLGLIPRQQLFGLLESLADPDPARRTDQRALRVIHRVIP